MNIHMHAFKGGCGSLVVHPPMLWLGDFLWLSLWTSQMEVAWINLLHLAIYGVCRLNLLECGRSRSFSCHSKAVCLDFHILTYVYSCVHIWHCSLGSESPLGGLLYQCLLPWLSGALLFVQEELLRGSTVCGIQSGMNIKEKGRQMREQIILKFQLG